MLFFRGGSLGPFARSHGRDAIHGIKVARGPLVNSHLFFFVLMIALFSLKLLVRKPKRLRGYFQFMRSPRDKSSIIESQLQGLDQM